MFGRIGIFAFMDADDGRVVEFSQQPCLPKHVGHVAFHRRIMQGLDHDFFIKIAVMTQKRGAETTRSQDFFG